MPVTAPVSPPNISTIELNGDKYVLLSDYADLYDDLVEVERELVTLKNDVVNRLGAQVHEDTADLEEKIRKAAEEHLPPTQGPSIDLADLGRAIFGGLDRYRPIIEDILGMGRERKQ